jgi:UDP-N-acetylmuramoylalanine--D-glutamate ligase
VATIDAVAFVNDSKATNAEAAARALACYETIYWIAGGRAKAGGIEDLAPFFPRIRHAFLIGEAAPIFAEQLRDRVPATHCGELAAAVSAAHAMARRDGIAGAVVLLSPACASWDQFANFEARGETFKRLVLDLPGART